ncbi:MAG: hypothetical protein KC535_04140 [Nanoarchaeota archaeon]|nr:hypothetical protein [Nanoarchaeota archaeon]
MVQITLDTQRDSTVTLQRVIQLLEEELRHRGEHPISPLPGSPIEPMTVGSSPLDMFNTSSSSLESTSPSPSFTDMFGGNDNSDSMSDESNTASESSSPAPDMFSVFSHDAPSESDELTHAGQSAESFISSQMTVQPSSTPSASELLEEDDVKDRTEDLARQVWQTGSTRKPESPFKLEPYD